MFDHAKVSVCSLASSFYFVYAISSVGLPFWQLDNLSLGSSAYAISPAKRNLKSAFRKQFLINSLVNELPLSYVYYVGIATPVNRYYLLPNLTFISWA